MNRPENNHFKTAGLALIITILLVHCKPSDPGTRSSGSLDQAHASIVQAPEIAPRFSGCEELPDSVEKKKCADKKLLEYVYTHIQYPDYAKEHGVQGRCVISFVVEQDSTVSNAKIIKDIGGGCGEASLHVVNTMNETMHRWIPGIDKGKPVRSLYYLPVNFKLQAGEKK